MKFIIGLNIKNTVEMERDRQRLWAVSRERVKKDIEYKKIIQYTTTVKEGHVKFIIKIDNDIFVDTREICNRIMGDGQSIYTAFCEYNTII